MPRQTGNVTQGHKGTVEVSVDFSGVFRCLGPHSAKLRTRNGTRFEAEATVSRTGKKVIRFKQEGKEYARSYECCWGHYSNCYGTRIGMYCRALGEWPRVGTRRCFMVLSVEQRLRRVERENRRIKLGMLAVMLVTGSLFLLGQSRPARVPELIKAQKFQVVDREGRVRIMLGVSGDGSGDSRAIVGLQDRSNRVLAVLAVSEYGGSALTLNDVNEKPLVVLAGLGYGTSGLTFNDKDGNARAVLTVWPERQGEQATPSLRILDANQKVVFKAP